MADPRRMMPRMPIAERQRLEEEKQKQKSKAPTVLAGVAAAAGIGYMAYKNYGTISRVTNKLKSAGTITVNKMATNAKFTGAISETLNLNEALDEMIDYSPTGLLRTFRKKGNTEFLQERIKAKNNATRKLFDKTFLDDIQRDKTILKQNLRNTVHVEVGNELLDKMFENADDIAKKVGDKSDDLYKILKSNSGKLFGSQGIDNDTEFSTSFYRMIQEYSEDNGKSVRLNFVDKDDEKNFIDKAMGIVKEINEDKKMQEHLYRNAPKSNIDFSTNRFAQKSELYDMAKFNSVRENHKQKADAFREAMLDNGYEQVTMKQARDSKVKEINGKLFVSDAEDAVSLQEYFGNKFEKNDFVEQYIGKGVSLGLSKDSLEKDLFSSDLYIDKVTGELMNTGMAKRMRDATMDSFESNFEIPFLRFNPISFLPGRKTQDIQKEMFTILKGGRDIQPLVKSLEELNFDDELKNINARSKRLAKSYMYDNGKLIDSDIASELTGATAAERFQQFTENINKYQLDGEFSIGNARSGLTSSYAQAVSGRTNRDDLDSRNPILKALGIGGQEVDSNIDNFKNWFKSKIDSLHSKSTVEAIKTDALEGDGREAIDILDRVRNSLYSDTRNMDRDSQEAFYNQINQAFKASNIDIDMFKLHDDDYAAESLIKLASRKVDIELDTKDINKQIRKNLNYKINQQSRNIQDNYEDFKQGKRYLHDNRMFKPDSFFNQDESARNSVSAMDDVRMLIEQYGINEADYHRINLTSGIYNTSGIKVESAEKTLARMRAINEVSFFEQEFKGKDRERNKWAAEFFNEYYSEGSRPLTNLSVSLKDADPILGTPFQKGKNVLGDTEYIVIADAVNPLKEINSRLIDAANNPQTENTAVGIAKNLAEDMFNAAKSSFAGANSENITSTTRDLWFFANRLDTSMQQLGLGLENSKKGSFFSIIANQHLTRFMAPLVAFEYLKYIDGLTGDTMSNMLADGYVNMQLDMASIKETLGINSIGRSVQETLPWLGSLGDTLPFKAFNTMTLGMFSEFRNREDLEEYYTSGEDAVRKGRYWGLGSSNPYQGGRISHFEPNWYRKLKSDYMFSENVYGSEREYWANHWLPTPTNPFAPVRHFITDPYHYEEKHAESRPYVMTGGFDSIQQIPLIGTAVDSVVSKVLKPTRINPRFKQAHLDYVNAQNERIVSSYMGMNAGGYVTFKSGGGINLHSDAYSVNINDESVYDEDGLISEEALIDDAESFTLERDRYIAAVYNNVSLDDVYISGGNGASGLSGAVVDPQAKGIGQGGLKVQLDLRAINTKLTNANSTNYNDNPIQAGTLIDPSRIMYQDDVVNSRALLHSQGVIKDMTYRATEMGGMYGFLFNTISGNDEKRENYVLESSDRFNDMADKFWDLNLGGLGGDYSEIFRRYFPRDKNKYYNPIRNTMPSWMPGSNYYIDFQHGDAFSKIANGEMRLPGQAHEKLFNVRKDEYGNYSAFDRYRILADVAPYSEEYRMAKKEVSLLNANGLLDEEQKKEYAEIRKQVTAKNKKHDFHEDRFRDLDLSYETVTVKEVLDNNTFTVEEYDNNPIRFAGVRVGSDSEAAEIVKQMIKPGQRLKIALDNNPQNRIRDDSLKTMRAVVFAPKNQEGLDFTDLGLGRDGLRVGANINQWLSNQEGVTVNDDETDISTLALFNDGERALGAFGNFIRRDVIENIPVLNVFADVYMPVESAVESYEAQVYGKGHRDWGRPIETFLKPSVNAIIKNNPTFASIQGGALVAMFTRKNRWKGFWAGAAVFGSMAGVRAIRDAMPGTGYDTWKPEKTEKQYEVDEYFDRLTYVKYKGLYNKAVELAKEKEGVDLERIFRIQERNEDKGLEEYLLERKRLLTIKKKALGDEKSEKVERELEKVKNQLEMMGDEELLAEVGPYTALALRYRNTYLSTLHAAGTGETFDYNQVYRALPSKDRPYFTEFIKAKPRDRRKILELVPRNQRAIYQRYFGMEQDEVESNESFFSRFALPDKNWEGWEAGISLDSVKVKVMQNEGIDLTASNYWQDDVEIANEYGIDAIDLRPSIADMINIGELEKILRGEGLEDVKISVMTNEDSSSRFTTNINIVQDRTKEIAAGLATYMQYNT